MNIIISNQSDLPIYEQIAESFKEKILSGELSGGELLPSIRSLAKDLRISVITTKRAYEELEKEGFIYSRAGKGSYISSPQHNVFSMSFSEDDSGNQTKYRNITVIEPSEEIRNALELNSSDKVIEISRVISRNGIRR